MASHNSSGASRAQSLYFAAWRWHFYAGLFVAPFLIMLATTGLVMLYVSAFVGLNGERMTVQRAAAPLAVSQLEAVAAAAVPGGQVTQYIEPLTAGNVAVFRVAAGETAMAIQINPYTADIVGLSEWDGGWYPLATDIHGSLLLGTFGDRLIEIAAGFGVVLILTGLYLWWPRDGGLASALIPNLRARGRALWKTLHQTVGFWISALLLAFLITGHSWTGVWGEKFVQAWSTFPAEKWDNVPLSDVTHIDMNHGSAKEVPWNLEQTPMPESGSAVGTAAIDGAVTLDSVTAFARSLGLVGRFQINLPADETGVWTISHDSMSNDGPNPASDRTIHLDQYTGRILADVAFADYSPVAKAMAVGVAFHEGDIGTWNLVLNAIFCLSIIFMAASGLVMWWKRRPSGASRLAAPPLPVDLPMWKGAVLLALVVSLAFPLVGLTLLAVLALDLVVVPMLPAVKRVLS